MRTATYARVSTQRQAQTKTIDQQIDRPRKHVEAAGAYCRSQHTNPQKE